MSGQLLLELQRKNGFTELIVCSSKLKMKEEKNSKPVLSVGPLNKSAPLLHEKLGEGVWESRCCDSG